MNPNQHPSQPDDQPDCHPCIRRNPPDVPSSLDPSALSDYQLRAFFDGALDAIVIADDDGRYVDANPAACALFGLTKAELLGRKIIDFAEPGFDFAAAWQAFQQDAQVKVEFRLVRPDGTVRAVECAATANFFPHRHLSILRDVSDRKQMEQELQRLNQELEQRVEQRTDELRQVIQYLTFHVEHSPLGFIGWDSTFCIQLWSQRAEQIFGWRAAEVLGKRWDELPFVDATDMDDIKQVIARLLKGEQVIHGSHNYRKDGVVLYCEWYSSAQLDDAGNVISVLSLVQDISDRKQVEMQRQQLETELRLQAEREHLLVAVTQRIRQSLDLNDILNTTAAEVRQLLNVDRVVIYRFEHDFHGTVIVESITPGWRSLLNQSISDPCFAQGYVQRYRQGYVTTQSDIRQNQVSSCYRALLEAFQVKATLVVPVLPDDALWGLLIAHQCDAPRQWQPWEIAFMKQLAGQVGIAIQQSELHRYVYRLNAGLEREVKKRTTQLQLASEFESTLKRITDKVRDSLDEHQILQSAVEELGQGLGVLCCNAALFDLDAGTSTVCYEYTMISFSLRGRVSQMADFPEIYIPLLEGQYFQFCSLLPNEKRGKVAMLCCPISDDQGVLGDLWLVNQSYYAYCEQDIRLVQQVANQCAIALRQSRLYQASQAQVYELERLNYLKDDFLSTVSHELRTPMASIKMATQMLEILLFKDMDPSGQFLHPNNIDRLKRKNTDQTAPAPGTDAPDHPPAAIATPSPGNFQQATRYFQILKEECQREIGLINDLLDLTRVDAGTDPLVPTTINLQTWLPHLAELFVEQAHQHQQQLVVAVAPDTTPIMTDLSYLRRILTELLNNAFKYTPAGETIRLTAKMTNDANAALNGSSPNSMNFQLPSAKPFSRDMARVPLPTVLIRVTNTGVEIPIEETERIFDKFYRIPNNDPWKYGGTGLGLALAKRLSERIGGTIWVESAQRQTSFMVKLPLEWNEPERVRE